MEQTQSFSTFLSSIAGCVFILLLSLLLLCFFISLGLALYNYSGTRIFFFSTSSFVFFALLLSVEISHNRNFYLITVLMFISIFSLFSTPILILTRKKKQKNLLDEIKDDNLRAKNLVKNIEIENQREIKPKSIENTLKTVVPKKVLDYTKSQEDENSEGEILPKSNVIKKMEKINSPIKQTEINFEHVKSVITRLSSFPLNGVEKQSISHLKSLVLQAENGGLNTLIKKDINEELGALLKIIAKYNAV